MNLLCLQCANEKFVEDFEAIVTQEFRGEHFEVITPAMRCINCGWLTLTDEQVDELRGRTADEYRKRHGILSFLELTISKLNTLTGRDWSKYFVDSKMEFFRKFQGGLIFSTRLGADFFDFTYKALQNNKDVWREIKDPQTGFKNEYDLNYIKFIKNNLEEK